MLCPLGGDGFMLQTLHRFLGSEKPIYGMNRGSVGFLMNEFKERGLRKRLAAAQQSLVHPLAMRAIDRSDLADDPTLADNAGAMRDVRASTARFRGYAKS